MIDPQQLRAFLAVADSGSFSVAAERLAVTQPAVSKRVAGLEALLGTRLFDRIGRRVQLTEAGAALQPEAVDILRRLTDLQDNLRSGPGQVTGTLQLATSHHIGLHRLAPVLRAFRQRHAAVTLDIRFEDSEVAHNLVRAGHCELAVVTLDPSGQQDLSCRLLWNDPLEFIAAAEHAAADAPIELAELAALPAILPGPGTYTGQLISTLFSRAGLHVSASMQTNYLETIRMLVAAGYGWSALPATMLGPELVALPVRGVAPPARSLGLVTHPQRTASAAAEAFRATLVEFADPG